MLSRPRSIVHPRRFEPRPAGRRYGLSRPRSRTADGQNPQALVRLHLPSARIVAERFHTTLRARPLQFRMFLAALFGEDQMEKLISSSVQQVKTIRAVRRKNLGREPGSGKE